MNIMQYQHFSDFLFSEISSVHIRRRRYFLCPKQHCHCCHRYLHQCHTFCCPPFCCTTLFYYTLCSYILSFTPLCCHTLCYYILLLSHTLLSHSRQIFPFE